MDLFAHLHEAGVLKVHKIMIIVVYDWQRRLWIEALRKFATANKIPLSDLPNVLTASSLQGREQEYVIFDSVLSAVNGLGGLGLAQAQQNPSQVEIPPGRSDDLTEELDLNAS